MSDFYQILKREIKPGENQLNTKTKDEDFNLENDPVDNSISESRNKIKSQTRAVKNKVKSARAKAGRTIKNKRLNKNTGLFSLKAANPIWLTMAETAKLGGVQKRTIKRALRSGHLKFRIVEGRYQVDLRSTLVYFFSRKKLWNKLIESGIGQYVEKWRN